MFKILYLKNLENSSGNIPLFLESLPRLCLPLLVESYFQPLYCKHWSCQCVSPGCDCFIGRNGSF